jgi:hypothetical protein
LKRTLTFSEVFPTSREEEMISGRNKPESGFVDGEEDGLDKGWHDG